MVFLVGALFELEAEKVPGVRVCSREAVRQ